MSDTEGKKSAETRKLEEEELGCGEDDWDGENSLRDNSNINNNINSNVESVYVDTIKISDDIDGKSCDAAVAFSICRDDEQFVDMIHSYVNFFG